MRAYEHVDAVDLKDVDPIERAPQRRAVRTSRPPIVKSLGEERQPARLILGKFGHSTVFKASGNVRTIFGFRRINPRAPAPTPLLYRRHARGVSTTPKNSKRSYGIGRFDVKKSRETLRFAAAACIGFAASLPAGMGLASAQLASPPPASAPTPPAGTAPRTADPCGGPGRLLATLNRPTVGYSPCAVKAGTAVFELGYQNQVTGSATSGSTQSQVPQNFLRFGVARNFEADVIGPNYERTRTYAAGVGNAVTAGVADYGLGFKYELVPFSIS
jgi:hypothetical protein